MMRGVSGGGLPSFSPDPSNGSAIVPSAEIPSAAFLPLVQIQASPSAAVPVGSVSVKVGDRHSLQVNAAEIFSTVRVVSRGNKARGIRRGRVLTALPATSSEVAL